jgi:hypothetical protein
MAFVRSVVVESLEWLRIADLKQNQATYYLTGYKLKPAERAIRFYSVFDMNCPTFPDVDTFSKESDYFNNDTLFFAYAE